MPAQQQQSIGAFSNSSGLPRPQLNRLTFNARDGAGSALAQTLNVAGDVAGKKVRESKAQIKAYEDEVNVAHAQLGLEEFNNSQAKGGLSLLTGDFDRNVFDAKKGELSGVSYAGELARKYAENLTLQNSADPDVFREWIKQESTGALQDAISKGPSYHASFIKQLGSSAELLSKQYADQSQSVLKANSAAAVKERFKIALGVDLKATGKSTVKRIAKNVIGGAWKGAGKKDLSKTKISELLKDHYEEKDENGKNIPVEGGATVSKEGLKKAVKTGGYSEDDTLDEETLTEFFLNAAKAGGLGAIADGKASIESVSKSVREYFPSIFGDAEEPDNSPEAKQKVAELNNLVEVVANNPHYKGWLNNGQAGKKGEVRALLESSPPPRENTSRILEDEKGTGLNFVDLRDQYTEVVKESIDSGNFGFDEEFVDAEIKANKLNNLQASKIREAAAFKRAQVELQESQKTEEQFKDVDSFITTGEGLDKIYGENPRVAEALLKRTTTGFRDPNVNVREQSINSKRFLSEVDYDEPDFKENITQEFLEGNISQSAYKIASAEYKRNQKAKSVTEIPAINATIDEYAGALTDNAASLYKKQISLLVSEQLDAGTLVDSENIITRIEAIGQRFVDKTTQQVLNNPLYSVE